MDTQEMLAELERLFAERLGLRLNVEAEPTAAGDTGADAVGELAGTRLLFECSSRGTPEAVGTALRQLEDYGPLGEEDLVPVVVVPYMGETGKRLCEDAGVAWADLSGNARIVAPGVRVIVEGQPNRYVQRGRPRNVFAPKASRLTRAMLLDPFRAWLQSELAEETGLDKGFVSKIVRRLERTGLVVRTGSGAVHPAEPGRLLEAWRAAYDFSRHDVRRGVMAARTGSELLERLTQELSRQGIAHAATGLAAAWLYAPFASFRVATVYLHRWPSGTVLSELGFRGEERGANVWLVVPNDDGVFTGGTDRNGIPCVSAVQTYVDLAGQPERAEEAAAELRRECLSWDGDAR